MNGRVTIKRYEPLTDAEPYYVTYEYPYEKGMTVLDVVMYVAQQIDPTLGFSYCCRNSHCGLCGARINGVAGLMCREPAEQELTLEPLENLPVIRDLMVDRNEFEHHTDSLRLFLDGIAPRPAEPEHVDKTDHDLWKVVSRCVECFSCVSECPVIRDGKHDYLGPAALVQLARHMFDPRDELDRNVVAFSSGLYNCTTCGRCTSVCPHGIEPSEKIQIMREHVVREGVVPPGVRELRGLVESSGYALMKPKAQKTFLEKSGSEDKGEIGLFVGCSINLDPRLHQIAESAMRVLTRLGVRVVLPKAQVCCGAPLKENGISDLRPDLIVRNVEMFSEMGVKTVITLCGACGVAAKNEWPVVYEELTGRKMPFEVKDFNEYVAATPDLGTHLGFLADRVTYHDPCTLRLGQGISEEPRQLLKQIPGILFQEMPGADLCCGGGGGVRLNNASLSSRILSTKIGLLQDMEVDSIATACPTCIKQLKIGLARGKIRRVEVTHTAVILDRSMNQCEVMNRE